MKPFLPSAAESRLGALLARHTGQTLSEARRWRVESSLRPVLRQHGLPTLDALLAAIDREKDGRLLAATIDAMLNHESSFFRDFAVFRALEREVLPAIHAQAKDKTLRIWCAGCSTGQEAYSLAMLLKRMGSIWDGWRIHILATDVSAIAIDKAKRGRFPQLEMQRGLPINDLLRWFSQAGDEWQVADEIRSMISFHTDNLLETRRATGIYDLIFCRNTLFYFPQKQREIACQLLASHARAGTYLVLGAGEMLTGGNHAFSNCRDLSCIYVALQPTTIPAPTFDIDL